METALVGRGSFLAVMLAARLTSRPRSQGGRERLGDAPPGRLSLWRACSHAPRGCLAGASRGRSHS